MPAPWFDELARILAKVEEDGVLAEGLFDAYIAMFFKVDGSATPLGQRSLCVFLLSIAFGPLLVLIRCIVVQVVGAQLKPGMILRRCLLAPSTPMCMSSFQMSLSLLT